MTGELIPVDVQQFIVKRIDSIAQLEALLLLSGHAHVAWTAENVARRLYISEQDTVGLMERMKEQGFVAVVPGEPVTYRYDPQSAELDAMVKRVVESYVRHLVPVTNLVHEKARARVRQFADAFKFRKEE
jgi:protein tyrosine phosphatase (PTP) superfamily phosphohydrolase (DUF442 family)